VVFQFSILDVWLSLCKVISWEYVTCFMESVVEHITASMDNLRNVRGNYAVGALIFSNYFLCYCFLVLVLCRLYSFLVCVTHRNCVRLGVIVLPALSTHVQLSSNWYSDYFDVYFEETRLYIAFCCVDEDHCSYCLWPQTKELLSHCSSKF
jgi:hypothetical protein